MRGEAKVAALYHSAAVLVPLPILSEELVHKQSSKPLSADNNTASDIMNGTSRQKKSKAIATYVLLKDRVEQKMSKV